MPSRCRSGTNNCLVTEETRNCISCRYNKCIKAGMKVLEITIITYNKCTKANVDYIEA